ncbi:LacI family transcriptional regulator [Alicyclobacillus sacchari]|uniref:LacI family transcriptional regulator n=1 Tax=Alicyclobacillus sacchari TaxID=392010 RepID=A0A4R8LMJ7_9BACL|nr:LacI family DNA-binding transcriptional regulator [Alicyclobacillus sacchari]TDY46581.1 LacI family transcriptional regulator [Alicyclobacillus sacchari]
MELATIRDVAKRAGVAVSTVSRVINQSGYVGGETQRKVLSAMRELNFQPNRIARGLVSRQTSTIGLLIPDVANPFFSELSRGVEDAAIARGYSVLLCNSDWNPNRENMYINLLNGRWVDGIIVVGSRSDISVVQQVAAETPLVMVDRRSSDFEFAVWTDNRQGAMLAVRHLLEVGCERIVHIAGPMDSPSAQERRRGYEVAIQEAGMEPMFLEGDFRYASGFELVNALFQRGDVVDGIFAGNDLMAIGALQAAANLGIRVPDNLAVVGYDNIPSTHYVSPPLTTIDQPAYDMGYSAFELLYDRLSKDSPTENQQMKFEPKLVLRESTRR